MPQPGHFESTPRRIRVLFNKIYVADSQKVFLAWEHRYYPYLYIPASDVKTEYISDIPSGQERHNGDLGFATRTKDVRLSVDGKETDKVIWVLEGDLKDHLKFDIDAMDGWFAEDHEFYGHPQDPYVRLTTLPSSHNIRIKVHDTVVATADYCVILLETNLIPRYYIPKTSLDWRFTESSKTTTLCPYKGVAQYYSCRVGDNVGEDVAWWYTYPMHEVMAIKGMVCFLHEREEVVVEVDGQVVERPREGLPRESK